MSGKYVKLIAGSALVLLSVLALYTSSFGLTVDRALAMVNGEVITLSDYGRFVAKTDQFADREGVTEQDLRRLIEERLILQEAKRKGYDAAEEEISQAITGISGQLGISEKELETRLGSEGISISEYRKLLRDNLISLKCIEREVDAKVMIGEEELKVFYEKQRQLFIERPESATVMAIILKINSNPSLTELTDLKIKSVRIYSEILNGEPFERQVYKYGDDAIKNTGGILGEFEKGALISALDEKIFSMKEGDVSEPVWTKEGVYILKIAKRSGIIYTPLEKVRDEVYGRLFREKRDGAYSMWMKKIWENSSVTIQ